MSISKQEMALVHGFMSKVAENDLPDEETQALSNFHVAPGHTPVPVGGSAAEDASGFLQQFIDWSSRTARTARTALDPSLMDAAGEWFANNKDTLQGAGIGAGAGGIGVPALVAVLSKLLGKGAPSRKSLLALAGAGALAGGGAGAYLSGAGEDPVIP